jgi:hypothetical protein
MRAHRSTLIRSFPIAAALIASAFAGGAKAEVNPYPHVGQENTGVYTFVAPVTGTITAYFAGSGAGYDEQVGMLVNGVSTGVIGLDDHTSSVGQSLVLGNVTAGDVLTFVDYVYTSGNTWYSNPALNQDDGNHVYSIAVAANQLYSGSVAGTYVGFEDLYFPNSDFNYFDDTFVFTDQGSALNTLTTSQSAPAPAPGAGLAGLLCLVLTRPAARRRRTGREGRETFKTQFREAPQTPRLNFHLQKPTTL